MKPSELLNAIELAKQLKVSPSTVRAWARAGRIPVLRLSRKAIRFDLDAVMRAVSSAQGVTNGK
jgi:excisionase family DNA binding protein